MLPKWHIFWGFPLVFVFWVFNPSISYLTLLLLFSSSVLIDIDHYITAVTKTKRWSISKNYKHYKNLISQTKIKKSKGIREKGDFFLFHTLEFHLLIALLSFIWIPMFYVFIGMVYHSIFDVIWMVKHDLFYSRHFFFFSWLRKLFFR
jgi:hypothetical protein